MKFWWDIYFQELNSCVFTSVKITVNNRGKHCIFYRHPHEKKWKVSTHFTRCLEYCTVQPVYLKCLLIHCFMGHGTMGPFNLGLYIPTIIHKSPTRGMSVCMKVCIYTHLQTHICTHTRLHVQFNVSCLDIQMLWVNHCIKHKLLLHTFAI